MKVVKTGVGAVWDQQVERTVMAAAWRRAKIQGIGSLLESTLCGAVGAFCVALKQAGWSAPAFNVVLTRQGHHLHLNNVDPKTVMRHLKDDWDI